MSTAHPVVTPLVGNKRWSQRPGRVHGRSSEPKLHATARKYKPKITYVTWNDNLYTSVKLCVVEWVDFFNVFVQIIHECMWKFVAPLMWIFLALQCVCVIACVFDCLFICVWEKESVYMCECARLSAWVIIKRIIFIKILQSGPPNEFVHAFQRQNVGVFLALPQQGDTPPWQSQSSGPSLLHPFCWDLWWRRRRRWKGRWAGVRFRGLAREITRTEVKLLPARPDKSLWLCWN